MEVNTETPPGEEHPVNTETPPAETPVETPPAETPPAETPPAEGEPAPKEGEPSETLAELDCSGFKFNGFEVTVEVPEDLRADLSSKGIDVNKLVTELYTSEDFSLSAETKECLDNVFGKAAVDSYLSALKDQNTLNIEKYASSEAAVTAAEQAAWSETVEQIGGEEVWGQMEAWAAANLSDTDFNAFNEVMSSGNRYAQKLVITDMLGKFRAAEGDSAPVLIEGEAVTVTEGQALSREAYRALFTSGEYNKNPKLYDALRRKGQAMGI